MSPIMESPSEPLLVVGFRGAVTAACATNLPIVRRGRTGPAGILDVARGAVGPCDPWEVVEERAATGGCTLFPETGWAPVPPRFGGGPVPASQPLVLAASLKFLGTVHQPFPGEPPTDLRDRYREWVWAAGAGPVARVVDEAEGERVQSGWAGRLIRHAEAALGQPETEWEKVRKLGHLAEAAARDDRGLRYASEVRRIAGFYFDPSTHPEQARELFDLFVRAVYHDAGWDQFRADMTVVRATALDRHVDAERALVAAEDFTLQRESRQALALNAARMRAQRQPGGAGGPPRLT